MSEAWIIDAVRTPRGIGKYGKGALSEMHPQQLGAAVLKALAERNKINTAEVDDVIWGTSSQRGPAAGDLGRMSALDAGYDIKSSGVTLDRFCGSGITTVNFAASTIMAGMSDMVVAGGCEMMSMPNRRSPEDGPVTMDQGNLRLRAKHPQSHQGICADSIATLEGISREALRGKGSRQLIRRHVFIQRQHEMRSHRGTQHLRRPWVGAGVVHAAQDERGYARGT